MTISISSTTNTLKPDLASLVPEESSSDPRDLSIAALYTLIENSKLNDAPAGRTAKCVVKTQPSLILLPLANTYDALTDDDDSAKDDSIPLEIKHSKLVLSHVAATTLDELKPASDPSPFADMASQFISIADISSPYSDSPDKVSLKVLIDNGSSLKAVLSLEYAKLANLTIVPYQKDYRVEAVTSDTAVLTHYVRSVTFDFGTYRETLENVPVMDLPPAYDAILGITWLVMRSATIDFSDTYRVDLTDPKGRKRVIFAGDHVEERPLSSLDKQPKELSDLEKSLKFIDSAFEKCRTPKVTSSKTPAIKPSKSKDVKSAEIKSTDLKIDDDLENCALRTRIMQNSNKALNDLKAIYSLKELVPYMTNDLRILHSVKDIDDFIKYEFKRPTLTESERIYQLEHLEDEMDLLELKQNSPERADYEYVMRNDVEEMDYESFSKMCSLQKLETFLVIEHPDNYDNEKKIQCKNTEKKDIFINPLDQQKSAELKKLPKIAKINNISHLTVDARNAPGSHHIAFLPSIDNMGVPTTTEVRVPACATEQEINALKAAFKDHFIFTEPSLDTIPKRVATQELEIKLKPGSIPPKPAKARPLSPIQLKYLEGVLKKYLEKGHIRPSRSQYAARVLFALKPDGGLRFCVDYRELNKITERDLYPFPSLEEAIQAIGMSEWFSSLDLHVSFHQLRVREPFKTAFITPFGQYEFTVVPFGLTNAPPTLCRFMDETFDDLPPEIKKAVKTYMDDIGMHTTTFSQMVIVVIAILAHCRLNGLHINARKSDWFTRQLKYLGHLISKDRIEPNPAAIRAVTDMPVPTDVPSLRRFLGLTGWLRKFCKNKAAIEQPLTELLHKDKLWEWRAPQIQARKTLIALLTSKPFLLAADPNKPYLIIPDTSYL